MIRPGATGERWVALFLLAVLLLSPPFLSIFGEHQLMSVPFIYLYLFLSWGLVIALLALAAESSSAARESGRSPSDGEDGEPERGD